MLGAGRLMHMLEYIGYGVGGLGLLVTVFITGQNQNKNTIYVKKKDCKKDHEKIHEKINEIGKGVARIEGHLGISKGDGK